VGAEAFACQARPPVYWREDGGEGTVPAKRYWLGPLLSLFFLGLFFWRVPLRDLSGSLASANYLYMVPGVALYLLALAFRTLRWQVLLSPLAGSSFGRLWRVMAVGYMANNLLPLRLGEVVRAVYLARREGVPASAGLATIAIERVFDGLALLLLLAGVGLALPLGRLVAGLGQEAQVSPVALGLFFSVPFVGGTGLLLALAHRPGPARRALAWGARRLPGPVGSAVWAVGLPFLEGLAVLGSPRRSVLAFLLSFPLWLAEAGMFYAVGVGFGLVEPLGGPLRAGLGMVAVLSVANIGGAVPAAGGGVGPFEFFAQATLALMGVEVARASAYAVALHLALLVPVTLLGLVYLWTEGLSLRQVTRGAPALKGSEEGG